MKKNIIVLVWLLSLVIISGMIYAANEKDTVPAKNTAEQTAKEITYGQCVSQKAIIKNSCYATVKGALDSCKAQVVQDASKKDVVKQCQQTYKKDKAQCKTVFKSSKKECAKIKHNFLETVGSAFK